MSKSFLIAFGIGIVVIAIAVGGIFFVQRGDKIDLPGKILKVRTAALDDDSSVAVIDFRVANPSNILFQVREVTVEMDDNAGKSYLGQITSDTDAARLMEYMPVLGQKFNQTLMMKERISAHSSLDRMVAARFQCPLTMMEARKRFIVRVEEVDGKIFEYSEK